AAVPAATTSLNLTGNSFAQQMFGNAGINILGGKGGADIMTGFAGNDRYIVDNAADKIVEGAGQGTLDELRTTVSYTLVERSQVEIMRAADPAAATALNLAGNAIAQTMSGNAGANVLDGKAGADTMTGAGGNDVFVFDTTLGVGNIDRVADFSVAD